MYLFLFLNFQLSPPQKKAKKNFMPCSAKDVILRQTSFVSQLRHLVNSVSFFHYRVDMNEFEQVLSMLVSFKIFSIYLTFLTSKTGLDKAVGRNFWSGQKR